MKKIVQVSCSETIHPRPAFKVELQHLSPENALVLGELDMKNETNILGRSLLEGPRINQIIKCDGWWEANHIYIYI